MQKYDEIIKLLKVPEIVKPFLNIIYTEDDLEILAAIKEGTLSATDIEVSIEMLNSAYKDSVVDKILDKDLIKYKVSPLTVRLDNLASFQKEQWHKIDAEAREKIADWLFSEYLDGKKAKTVNELTENASKIVPLNIAIDFVKEVNRDIYVIPCDCKAITEGCNSDKNVCMSMGSGLNTSSDRGHGTKLDTEAAVELLKHADKEGLIHTIEENAICNCCSCCCYPLRASKELGLKGKWPAVSYVIEVAGDSCVNCGICVKRCPQNVFSKGKKIVKADISKCVGCGVCVSICPKKALHLEKL